MAENKSKYRYLDEKQTESQVDVRKDGYLDVRPIAIDETGVKLPGSGEEKEKSEAYINYISLRKEYLRHHRPYGWDAMKSNPIVPLGFGTMVFCLIYGGLGKRSDRQQARLLSWRAQTHVVTAVAIIGGFVWMQYKENRWIRDTAEQRGLKISEKDMIKLM